MFNRWENTHRIASKCLILAACIFNAGCGNLYISAPNYRQTNLSNPFTLEAKISEKHCSFNDSSFRAYIDKGQANQIDITNAFVKTDSVTWTAQNYDLPTGTHTFSVRGIFTRRFCGGGWADSDQHQYTILVISGSQKPILTAPASSTGSITLSWTYFWPITPELTTDGYELQESNTSSSSGFSTIQSFSGRTSPTTITINRAAGTYWYRVRASVQGINTGWSVVQQVSVSPPAARSLRIVNDLSVGGSDSILRFRIASTAKGRSVGSGAEQLSPDSYCAAVPGSDIRPGENYVHDLIGFGSDYYVHIGLGIWDLDAFGCPGAYEKKMWTTDAQFNLLYIYNNIDITNHDSGVNQCNIAYNAAGNIIASCGGTPIPFVVNVDIDPIQQ